MFLSGDDGKDKILISYGAPGTSRGVTVTSYFKELTGLSKKPLHYTLICAHINSDSSSFYFNPPIFPVNALFFCNFPYV